MITSHTPFSLIVVFRNGSNPGKKKRGFQNGDPFFRSGCFAPRSRTSQDARRWWSLDHLAVGETFYKLVVLLFFLLCRFLPFLNLSVEVVKVNIWTQVTLYLVHHVQVVRCARMVQHLFEDGEIADAVLQQLTRFFVALNGLVCRFCHIS